MGYSLWWDLNVSGSERYELGNETVRYPCMTHTGFLNSQWWVQSLLMTEFMSVNWITLVLSSAFSYLLRTWWTTQKVRPQRGTEEKSIVILLTLD